MKQLGRLAGGDKSGSTKHLRLWGGFFGLVGGGFCLFRQVMRNRTPRQDTDINHMTPVTHSLDSRSSAYRTDNQYKPLRLLLMARPRFQGVHLWQKLEPASGRAREDRRGLRKRKYLIGVLLQVVLHPVGLVWSGLL